MTSAGAAADVQPAAAAAAAVDKSAAATSTTRLAADNAAAAARHVVCNEADKVGVNAAVAKAAAATAVGTAERGPVRCFQVHLESVE